MSTVNVNRVVDASGGVLAPISSVMRNRIINGAMVISQRNAGASVTPANGGADYIYTLDRWRVFSVANSKFSVQQNAGSVTPPAGFTNYLGITSLAATSVSSTDVYLLNQRIEGFNFADLNWGTANAKTVTLSFWVRSSLTGAFGGALVNGDNSRSYPFSYTISSANTWTTISVTVPGDTTGTWVGATNGAGCSVQFGLGVGSSNSGTAGAWAAGAFYSSTGATSVVGTSGATLYITGVQLEVGTQATSFEYRQYQQELALCQRYYQRFTGTDAAIGSGLSTTSSVGVASIRYIVSMRATPTTGFSALGFADNVNYTGTVSSISSFSGGTDCGRLFVNTNAVMTALRAGTLNPQSGGYLELIAEL
jgi:hypothetical protein